MTQILYLDDVPLTEIPVAKMRIRMGDIINVDGVAHQVWYIEDAVTHINVRAERVTTQ